MENEPESVKLGETATTILVVDDEPANLSLLTHLLRPNYQVRAANSGENALRVATSEPRPDLILLDVMMPGMDGYAVLRQLKASPKTGDIPVIFVTAMDAEADEAHSLALGAVDYITKPVMPALLLARIATQIQLKDARDWLKDRNTVLDAEVARQVVELKAAKEAAEAASHSKSLFIDNMSHELRTPMNGVIGMLQLAQMEISAGDPTHPALEYLKIAFDSSQAMVNQLAAILEYASIAHGEVSLQILPVDLATLLKDVALSARRLSERKGLRFDLTIRSGLPDAINSDETRLRRMLAILLDNALKFTATGEVELGAEPINGGVHLWVRDTGIGISADKHKCIFTPFEQVDNSHTRQFGGAGLGLAIAIRLVELMDGRLWGDSTCGAGSTFHVTLQNAKPD